MGHFAALINLGLACGSRSLSVAAAVAVAVVQSLWRRRPDKDSIFNQAGAHVFSRQPAAR